MPKEKLSLDVAIGVTIPARDARGRATRIGPVLDEILANHNYPPVVERLLAEALTLTALLGTLLKDRWKRHASGLEGVTGTCWAMAPMHPASSHAMAPVPPWGCWPRETRRRSR